MGFATILITASVLVLGSTLASIEKTRIPDYQLKRLLDEKGERRIGVGEPVEVTGVLEREPEIAPGRWYITLRVEGISSRGTKREVSGVVMLLVPVSESRTAEELAARDLRYGGRIRAMTRLERTDSFRNPGVSSFNRRSIHASQEKRQAFWTQHFWAIATTFRAPLRKGFARVARFMC